MCEKRAVFYKFLYIILILYRWGATSQYYFGDDEIHLGEYAWFNGNSGKTTHPVGDLHGNSFGNKSCLQQKERLWT